MFDPNNSATHLNVNDCLLAVIKNQNKEAAKLLIKHGAKGDQRPAQRKLGIHYVIKRC